MEFNIVAKLIIGVIVILTVLMFFSPFPDYLRAGTCYFIGIFSYGTSQDSMSLPEFCRGTLTSYEAVTIYDKDKAVAARRIGAYTIACYRMGSEGLSPNDIECYDIYLDKVEGELTYDDVSNEMPFEYEDILVWNANNFTAREIVTVGYLGSTGKVRIE